MKKNSTKSLKWLAGTVIFFGLFYLALLVVQSCSTLFGWPNPTQAEWQEGIMFLQGAVVVLRFLGAMTFFILLVSFILNTIKAINDGILFPRKNVRLLFGCAFSAFIYCFCENNLHLIHGEKVIELGFEEVLVTTVLCIFAIIYRNAVQVSEENSLTI